MWHVFLFFGIETSNASPDDSTYLPTAANSTRRHSGLRTPRAIARRSKIGFHINDLLIQSEIVSRDALVLCDSLFLGSPPSPDGGTLFGVSRVANAMRLIVVWDHLSRARRKANDSGGRGKCSHPTNPCLPPTATRVLSRNKAVATPDFSPRCQALPDLNYRVAPFPPQGFEGCVQTGNNYAGWSEWLPVQVFGLRHTPVCCIGCDISTMSMPGSRL